MSDNCLLLGWHKKIGLKDVVNLENINNYSFFIYYFYIKQAFFGASLKWLRNFWYPTKRQQGFFWSHIEFIKGFLYLQKLPRFFLSGVLFEQRFSWTKGFWADTKNVSFLHFIEHKRKFVFDHFEIKYVILSFILYYEMFI